MVGAEAGGRLWAGKAVVSVVDEHIKCDAQLLSKELLFCRFLLVILANPSDFASE